MSTSEVAPKYATNAEVPFQHVANFLESCVARRSDGRTPTSKDRHMMLRRFMALYVNRTSDDTFPVIRLLCPAVSCTMMLPKPRMAYITIGLCSMFMCNHHVLSKVHIGCAAPCLSLRNACTRSMTKSEATTNCGWYPLRRSARPYLTLALLHLGTVAPKHRCT